MSVETHKRPPITLEELAKEKLKNKIIQQIDEADIEIWEKVDPGFRFKINKKYIEIRAKFSTKESLKKLAWLAGPIWVLIEVLSWLIPLVENYYK